MFPPFHAAALREVRRREDEQSVPFVAQARKRNSLQVLLSQQYDRSEYCDVTLKVGDEVVLAHRCVLAGISPYFRSLFPKDGKIGSKQVNLTDKFKVIQPITAVLEFIYHGEIQIEKNDVEGLLDVTRLFKMKDLEESCVHFLLKKLSLETCLWTWSVSFDQSLTEVEAVAQDVAVSRFHDTLITSKEALDIQPRHLLHFLKQGLGKFCKKSKMDSFLRRWCEYDKTGREKVLGDIKEAAGLSKEGTDHAVSETVSANQLSDVSGSTANNNERPDGQVEEVIYFTNSEKGIHLIYRPEKKLWLRVKIPQHYSALYGTITLDLFGLGSSAEFACFKTGNGRFRLLNICNNKVIEIQPECQESAADVGHSVRRYTLLCLNDGNLYSFKEEVFLKEKSTTKSKVDKKQGMWYEGLKGAYKEDTKTMWKIRIQHFDIDKRSWESLCESESEPGDACVKVSIIHRKDGSCFIICVREPWKILLWHLTPSNGQLQRMASPAANIPLRSLMASIKEEEPLSVLGTSDKLFIKLGRNALVYKIHENAWEVKPFPKDRPLRSTREVMVAIHGEQGGEIYLLFKQIRSIYFSIGMYSPFREQLTEVPAVPSYYPPTVLHIALVRSRFLDRLEEATCEDDMAECVLSPGGIRNTLKTARSRWREEALEAMSHGESLDEAEEMMWDSDGEDPEEQEDEEAEMNEAVFRNILMRQMMLNPFGIPPFF